MKPKKFPVVPVSLLGVAVIGGGVMIMNKPFVGDQEAYGEYKMQQYKDEQAQKSADSVTGESRNASSSESITNEMKSAMKPSGGNANRVAKRDQPLVTYNVPKRITKVPKNPAATAQQWWKQGTDNANEK